MDLTNRPIAVTGVTGFLGSYIALELLARGARPIGVVRSPEKAAWLAEKGVTMRKADLGDVAALTEAFRGCDAVVTCAALYKTVEVHSWADYLRINKEGTANAFDAAAAAGVKRIVHISTCGVYFPAFWRRITEESPRLKAADRFWMMWNYPVSKSISEDVAWERAKHHGLQLTVCRPAGIFGPRDTQAVPLFEKAMRMPILPAPWITFPMSHGADIAQGVVAAVANDAAVGKAYNLANDPTTFGDILHAWKAAAGKGPILVTLPLPIGLNFDNSAAKRDLGFTNRPLADTVKDIVASL
jgi:nucleoside-diphosphate-sugar epimerase